MSKDCGNITFLNVSLVSLLQKVEWATHTFTQTLKQHLYSIIYSICTHTQHFFVVFILPSHTYEHTGGNVGFQWLVQVHFKTWRGFGSNYQSSNWKATTLLPEPQPLNLSVVFCSYFHCASTTVTILSRQSHTQMCNSYIGPQNKMFKCHRKGSKMVKFHYLSYKTVKKPMSAFPSVALCKMQKRKCIFVHIFLRD